MRTEAALVVVPRFQMKQLLENPPSKEPSIGAVLFLDTLHFFFICLIYTQVNFTAFALGFSGDYYITQGFSIGPLPQWGFTGDLIQFGLTGQAKYTFDLKEIPALKPHIEAGIGFIYADLDRNLGRDEDDVSFLIPLGLGAEYRLTDSISVDTNFLFNFTDLDVRDKNFFFTWLVGMRYRF